MILTGNIINIRQQTIGFGEIIIHQDKIRDINIISPEKKDQPYYMPGFIDSHIHIESSMLVPGRFAEMAVKHGTVATISDPHEIANVMGEEGIKYMIENGKSVPFKFFFGLPSCVPATSFETAGAIIDVELTKKLIQDPDLHYLAEMMNWPGVLHRDKDVMAKIEAAISVGKPVDGHAPGLKGKDAEKYISAGISTDHECFSLEEALDKANLGMNIIIREGSAAKNFDALIEIFNKYPDQIMFCSDDKHPDDLAVGHINQLVTRALRLGYNLFDVLNAACIKPVDHYNLSVGTLNPGDQADFIKINNIKDFVILETWIDGKPVFSDNNISFSAPLPTIINNFYSYEVTERDIKMPSKFKEVPVIKVIDGSLITEKTFHSDSVYSLSERDLVDKDLCKLVVVNRYEKAPPAVCFIEGVGLKNGAFGGTVAHDSHNIIVAGTNDKDIIKTINILMNSKGGLAAANNDETYDLPLPVAGLMTTENGFEIGNKYQRIDKFVKELGSTLTAPFMSISFMALLVIPKIKLSDKGLFDAENFTFYN
ncbi:adenine deaminase [Marinigracilibium pacificum]|uniref:Adenine deaminase n=1 Tax=Marinigracilibium pacificum TaxID=2729599 RepID=A0A848IX47_9BACT|nr:adenine deaminase [Marinigracilibium pacificum]NMM49103.1 adenine deaminase [Marinigracilibium pacificum]